MPNIKSAKKRVITSEKKRVNNNVKTATAKNAIKNVERAVKAGQKDDEKLKVAIKAIDKAQAKGLIHKNKAAREKSRLTKMNNNVK